MTTAQKSLKLLNTPWLWAVVACDAIALGLAAVPGAVNSESLSGVMWLRATVGAVAPVCVLLLSSLLPSHVKAALVFWRLKDALPGHRAFSVHAPADPRIDLAALKRNVGAFPEEARPQNTLWAKLYKKVETDISVADAHRQFLLFRDLAAVSLLLVPVATIVLLALEVPPRTHLIAFVGLVLQYSAAAVAARHNGVRFVTNVLFLHSVKRRT